MMKCSLLVCVVSVTVAVAIQSELVQGKPNNNKDSYTGDYAYDENYDYNDGEDYTSDADRPREAEIEDLPVFKTKGSTFTFDKGTTMRLPCYVDKLPQNFMLMWHKVVPGGNDRMIAVGDSTLGNDHVDVEISNDGPNPGSTLVVKLAADDDAGQYLCSMATEAQVSIKHTVNIRAPPQISKSPQNGLILAMKGDTISLACEGNGSPQPTITWTRSRHTLPDGRDSLQAEEITYRNVDRHHSGMYHCTADNGFGAKAKETIEVAVEYSPEVEVEEVFYHARAGNTVELVCNVHARPMATVKWFKNSFELTNETSSLSRNKHRHTLTIQNISKEEFGNYTCRADNKWGEASKVLEISGKAAYPDFMSNPAGYEPNSYLLEWTSQSHTPVAEFELRWRQHGGGDWNTVMVEPILTNQMTYAGKHSIAGLNSHSNYEATVAARNDEGWNRHSPTFKFATFGAEPLTDASTDSATGLQICMPLLMAILMARFF